MKFLAILGLGSLVASLACAADVDVFTSKDMQAMARSHPAKGATYSDQNLAKYGNHYLLLVSREETGSSELHQNVADVFVVESGQATLLTGGKLVKPHTTQPGEIRGSSIEGGTRHALTTGDVVHISAGVPHQLLLEKGKPFTYFVVKVTGQ
jgi:mannose-6-phosphate isomerase-like protein (cupin superfamily)